MTDQHITAKSASDRISVELSSRRTGMSFQRTRMSADRTLMSVIRTSLSLISFGFTIYQVFEKLRDQDVLTHAAPPRNFGIALVALGIAHAGRSASSITCSSCSACAHERKAMTAAGLIHGESQLPAVAHADHRAVLLLIGVAAIISMVFQVGPFG